MANYDLSPDTAEDLEAIFDYTIDRWGIEQAHRYKNKLAVHFGNIGAGKVNLKAFSRSVPELQVSRCEHHYVFHFIRKDQPSLIIAKQPSKQKDNPDLCGFYSGIFDLLIPKFTVILGVIGR